MACIVGGQLQQKIYHTDEPDKLLVGTSSGLTEEKRGRPGQVEVRGSFKDDRSSHGRNIIS
jgi:hypothetical protein